METQPTVFASDMQKIGVTLSESDVFIEPGSVAQLVVTMTNRQPTPDRLTLEVEGVDVEWYMIPVAAVNVAPGAQVSERIVFKINRNSENRAGTYPFLVRVQAMESGEFGVAQAMLIVKPFTALQVDLSPKRGVSTFFHPFNEFVVHVSNLGNAEETVELYADDPEDECAYEFDMERVTLKPGQFVDVPLMMRPRSSALLGGSRLIGFVVTVRSVQNAYVAMKAHGQLEKRALISPLMGIFLLLLTFLGVAAYYFWPRPEVPAKIEGFVVSQTRTEAGREVTLSWDVTGGYQQILIRRRVGGNNWENLPGEQNRAAGSVLVVPEPPKTEYELIVRGRGSSIPLRRTVIVVVNPPPPAPKPKIESFVAVPDRIHLGEIVTLEWKTRDARRLILDPGNLELSGFVQSHQTKPDQDCEFTLRAIGEDPKHPPAEKKVTVKVFPPTVCIAEIDGFKAVPADPYIGDRVRLQWKTRYARSVRIESDRFDPYEAAPAARGTYEVTVTEPTTFRLIASDSLGRTIERTVTVTPKPRPVDTGAAPGEGESTPPVTEGAAGRTPPPVAVP